MIGPTLILVADRGGARLFAKKSDGLERIEMIDHPDGTLKGREIDSDKPGRSFDSVGHGRHANGREHTATDHVADVFALHLAKMLEQRRNQNQIGKLVLVADSRFLGKLRAALTPSTAKLVVGSLDSDLAGIPDRDLLGHVSHLLKPELSAS